MFCWTRDLSEWMIEYFFEFAWSNGENSQELSCRQHIYVGITDSSVDYSVL